ncbi:MAG TPA: energy transducer TonB [Bryobacteraceae bacterium]|nr:energy transducer TonB [Bryobacteraceae bacterium]
MKLSLALLAASVGWTQGYIPVVIDVGGNQLVGRPFFIATEPSKAAGMVKLQLTVSPTGAVVNAEARSGPEDLRESALNSARRWRFVAQSDQARAIEATVFFGPPPSEPHGQMRGSSLRPNFTAKSRAKSGALTSLCSSLSLMAPPISWRR